ncbi:beta-lactamase/transpeptidase-like protein [Trametes elegans]|nr:beta-lactamase/transpeptidase-like protein [Trametes elegans]
MGISTVISLVWEFRKLLELLTAVSFLSYVQWYQTAQAARLPPAKVITADVSAFVEDVLATSTIPGVSMGVVRLGTDKQPATELAAWGRRKEESDGRDLTPDTLFALASCSKAFVVVSVGQLMEDYTRGRNVTPLPAAVEVFNWDTRVADLLPGEWALQDDAASEKATLRDAFGHLTGLSRHDFSYRPGDGAADVVRRMRHLPPAYGLREQWAYNNQMYMVGAHIVAKYANVSYGSFVKSRIFEPLNMTSSTYSPSEARGTGRVTQTWTRGVRRIPYWFPDEVNGLFAGPGGAISSAKDMVKWLATLLNRGVDPNTNTTIVPKSTFANMTATRPIQNDALAAGPEDPPVPSYGMGWFRLAHKGHDVVWHFGAIPGFSLLVAFLPGDNLGIVILANMDEKQDENMSILFRVIDEALGLPRVMQPIASITDKPALSISEDDAVVVLTSEPKALPLELDAYAGSYTNLAYGNITFCTPSSTSPYCKRVLHDFAPVETAANETLPRARLYAAWPRVWSTHIRLRHASGNSFSLVFPGLFPRGYGANGTAFEFYDSVVSVGRAEFLTEGGTVRGFAMVTEEAAAVARRARNDTVEAIGDAWFTKVQ